MCKFLKYVRAKINQQKICTIYRKAYQVAISNFIRGCRLHPWLVPVYSYGKTRTCATELVQRCHCEWKGISYSQSQYLHTSIKKGGGKLLLSCTLDGHVRSYVNKNTNIHSYIICIPFSVECSQALFQRASSPRC